MCEKWESAIEAVRVAVEATDPDALDGPRAVRLTQMAAECERRCAAAKGTLARRVEELGAWKRSGHRSSAEWLAATSGSTLGQAVGALQTARHLEDLPETAAAFEAGELSEAQAREVAAAAIEDPDAERELLRAAQIETVKGLREKARAVRAAATDPEREQERYERIRRSRYLRNWTEFDGAVRIDARLTPDDGGRLLAAVDAHATRIGRTATAQGRREPAEAYRADGLVALARPGAHAPAAAVQVVVDAEALRRGHTVNGETCEIRGIGPVPVAAARRLLSDCILTTVVRDGVDIATIAHPGRTIPAALRRALEHRAPNCEVPGCDMHDDLEIDHVVGLEAGGTTTIRNLCRLCGWHHYLKTHRGYRLRGSPGDWRWEAPLHARPLPAPP